MKDALTLIRNESLGTFRVTLEESTKTKEKTVNL